MSAIPDPTAPLTASGNLRRRMFVSHVVSGLAIASALAAVAVLGIVVYGVASRGASVLSLSFITHNPVGLAGGGIAPAIVGTALIVACATLIATPLGVLTALYLTEFAGSGSRTGPGAANRARPDAGNPDDCRRRVRVRPDGPRP